MNEPSIGHWKAILRQADFDPALLTGKQCACPLCGGKDRFRFDDKDGRGTWFCNKCGAGDGYKLLMHKTGEEFKVIAERIREEWGGADPVKLKEERDHRANLNKLWGGAKTGSPRVTGYLKSRGIIAPPHCILSLRFHPRTPWSDGEKHGFAPAMLARVYQGQKPQTIHRTFLTDDVPNRRMMMPHNGKLQGCHIPLGPPVTTDLGVAEGIETALAAMQMYGWKDPVWSCVSAGQLERFTPEKTVDILSIYGDNDRTFTGQAAAYSLAKRLSCSINKPVSCNVNIPKVEGWDYNDVLLDLAGLA